ncbi:MAG: MFS transporter [Dehalococcoidia bacterium]
MSEAEPASLLQQRSFRRLTAARLTSRIAQYSLNFALVLLVVEATGRAFFSSLLVLALVLPTTGAGLVSGALADVFPRRLLMITGHVLRAILCFAVVGDDLGAPSYFTLAVLLSMTTPIATAAEGATLPAIVDRPLLARANAISQATNGLAQVAGFGIVTPVLLRVFGSADALFLACGVLFLLAAVNALLIGRVRSPAQSEIGRDGGDPWYVAGWRALRSDPRTWRATLELTLISTSAIILAGLVPAYLQDVLGLSVDIGVVALVPGVIGVGFGLRLAGFLARRVRHSVLSSTGFLIYVVSLLGLSAVNPSSDFLAGYGPLSWLDSIDIGGFDGAAVLASVWVVPLGFSFALVSVAAQTVLNDLLPLRLQGRAQATQTVFAALAASAPVLIGGAVADVVGVAPVMAAVAVVTAIIAAARPGSISGQVALAAR